MPRLSLSLVGKEELTAQGAAWTVVTTYPSSPNGRTFPGSGVSLLRLAQGRGKELKASQSVMGSNPGFSTC